MAIDIKNALKRTRLALRNDARIFNKDERGLSPKHPEALLVSSIAVLGIVGLISLSSLPGTMNPKAVHAGLPMAADAKIDMTMASDYDFRSLQTESYPYQVNTITLKSGDALGPLLQKNGIDPNTAYAMTQAFSQSYSPRALRAGQKITLYADADTGIQAFSLKPNVEQTIFVEKNNTGDFISRSVIAEFDKQLVQVEGAIENSLYLDAQSLGAPDKVIVQFAQIFAHSVDFQRDIRAGDAFEMAFEVFRDHKGNVIKAGDLVFTSFAPRGKTSSYYLFENDEGREGYYDADGKAAKRMLMRTPVNGARLSSRYGKRKHPVLGYRKMHKGVDFAAPTGTPIMAGGTGVITRASRYGSYGKYIRIRHTDGYSTAYAHLSKYARGVKSGKRVTQGQIIGYVGATGRVTGPHLHYEILKNGRQINPSVLATLSGKPLRKEDIPAFKERVKEIDTIRASLPVLNQPTPPAQKIAEQQLP